MRGRALLVIAAVLSVAMAVPAVGQAEPTWRQVATSRDRERLRGWRSAWVEGLAAARSGEGAAVLAEDPALFDPDRRLSEPLPPAGDYRCRVVKLGSGDVAPRVTTYAWGACRVEPDGASLRISKVDGAQRPTGLLYADGAERAIFLGAMALSDERRAFAYGLDWTRDMAGVVERIGPARWRIALPFPRFQSVLDVVELVPADRSGRN
jgi:hypothetical protein